MLDGVTGMNDIEAGIGERGIFDARLDERRARQTSTGIGIALIRFDGSHLALRRGFEKGGGEAAAIGADIQKRNRFIERDVPRQGVHCRLGTKAFAVTDIAPVRAAGYGRAVTLLCPVDARRALHQTAMAAESDFQAPCGALGLIGELEGIPAAKVAKRQVGVHEMVRSRIR